MNHRVCYQNDWNYLDRKTRQNPSALIRNIRSIVGWINEEFTAVESVLQSAAFSESTPSRNSSFPFA